MSNTDNTIINIGIVGAGGRMGQEIARLAAGMANVCVVAAFDKPNSPLIGTPLPLPLPMPVPLHQSNDSDSDSDNVITVVEALPTPDQAAEFFKSRGDSRTPHVLIDFTSVAGVLANMETYRSLAIPVVIGTTGNSPELIGSIKHLSTTTPVFYSANMSMGVYIMNKLTQQLAQLAQLTPSTQPTPSPVSDATLGANYDFEIIEAHHKHKLDAPSGTALMLAQTVVDNYYVGNGNGDAGVGNGDAGVGNGDAGVGNGNGDAGHGDGDGGHGDASPRIRCVRHGDDTPRTPYEVGVQSIRGGSIAGEHTVLCIGENDRIEVSHRATSRTIFAEGALQASVWLGLQHKKGCPPALYTMDDLFAT